MEALRADIYTLVETTSNSMIMNARHYFLTIVLSFALSGAAKSEMRMFLPGKKPSISLVQAVIIIERIIKKTNIKVFNPMSANLLSGKELESGAWNFVQNDKRDLVYRFVVYFPDDLCLILDEKNGQKLIGAFKRDGSPAKIEEGKKAEGKEALDPFAE